jgi:hypothetical protein
VRHELFVISFFDTSDSIALGNLRPLGHGLPRRARVIPAHIAALRTREDQLWCREECKTRVMHGPSQAQRVVRDLQQSKRCV